MKNLHRIVFVLFALISVGLMAWAIAVGAALEAGGLKLREDWTLLELIKDPPKIKKTVPHPAVLLEYPELEQVDYFREEPNDLKDAN